MSKHILVPLDGSPQAEEAFEYVLQEYDGITVTLLHVIDPIEAGYSAQATVPGYSEEWYEQSKEEAESLFDQAREKSQDTDIELQTEIELGRPARSILDYVEDNDIDQIVMGSHGRSGVTRILLGSVAEKVARRSPVPVTIVR
ncbi:MAG: universal stress protein [Halobacteriaceae archaeon]